MFIEEKRVELDKIDDYIVKLFLRRMEICGEIGEYKKENNLRVYDEKREKEVALRVSSMADENMRDYVDLLYETIIGLSNAYQLEIKGEE